MRDASTYRGARRNAAKGSVWRGIKPTGRYRWPNRDSERKRFLWRQGYPRSSVREEQRRERHAEYVNQMFSHRPSEGVMPKHLAWRP